MHWPTRSSPRSPAPPAKARCSPSAPTRATSRPPRRSSRSSRPRTSIPRATRSTPTPRCRCGRRRQRKPAPPIRRKSWPPSRPAPGIPRSIRRDRKRASVAAKFSAPVRRGVFLGKHAMKNLLTDIAGIRVGHADDAALASGVTAVIFDHAAVAAMDVRGGGPGTREGALLDLANTVERVDAIALAGGSAFGLEAGGGVQAWLAEQGRGFVVRGAVIPIVPGAICFDLLNGGNKKWGRHSPYRDLGYAAAAAAGETYA